MSHAMLVEMIVVISVISSLVVAFIAVILLAVYERALADLRNDASVYSLSVEGDVSHLEDLLRKLPWVVDLQTEPGPDDASGNLPTTILIQVTDPQKAERELPRIALDDATITVTAFSRGRHDRGVASAQVGVVSAVHTGAGIGRRPELPLGQPVEP